MSCYKPMLANLQQQGFRLTSQRALILEDLFHNPGHRTVEDIFQHVSERLPGLNRATIYRTLEMLRAVNLVAASPARRASPSSNSCAPMGICITTWSAAAAACRLTWAPNRWSSCSAQF